MDALRNAVHLSLTARIGPRRVHVQKRGTAAEGQKGDFSISNGPTKTCVLLFWKASGLICIVLV